MNSPIDSFSRNFCLRTTLLKCYDFRISLSSIVLLLFLTSTAHTFGAVRIVAHRGGVEVYPENTLEALVHAANSNLYGIEFDLRLTADSQIVIVHDAKLGRTTDVETKFGSDKLVTELTLEQVKTLYIQDGDGWKPEFSEKFRIPTFHDLLLAVKNLPVVLFIDLKTIEPVMIHKVEEELDALSIPEDRIILCSFNWGLSNATKYRTLFWDGSASLKPVLECNNISGSQVFQDSLYFRIDESIEQSYPFEFNAEGISRQPGSDEQYIFQVTDDSDCINWNSGLSLYGDDSLKMCVALKDGSSIRIFVANNNLITHSYRWVQHADVVDLFVDNVHLIHYPLSIESKNLSIPQTIIGADYRGNRKLNATMNSFSVTYNNVISASINLQQYPLENTIDNSSSSLVLLSSLNFTSDFLGLTSFNNNEELIKTSRKMGFINYAWPVYTLDELRDLSQTDLFEGVVTEYPYMFTNYQNFQQSGWEPSDSSNNSLINIYPNPTYPESEIFIRFQDVDKYNIQSVLIEVYDPTGKKVFSNNESISYYNNQVVIHPDYSLQRNLKPGIYFIKTFLPEHTSVNLLSVVKQ